MSQPRTLAPFGRRRGVVTAAEAVGAYRLLRCTDPGGPDPRPGQFYMLAAVERWGGGQDERPYLPRAFSYLRRHQPDDAAAARSGEPGRRAGGNAAELDFLVEDVGPGTRRLAELRPGDEMWLLGPLGRGFAAPGEGRRAVLAGGGIGIVPLACWQDELGPRSVVLLGFRDAACAQGARLLASPRVATDDGSVGRHALVTELLAEELDERGEQAEVYACGPPAMLEAVRALCVERDVPGQLALEAGMACGFGACFGCVVPTHDGYARVCVDGPVMAAAALEAA